MVDVELSLADRIAAGVVVEPDALAEQDKCNV